MSVDPRTIPLLLTLVATPLSAESLSVSRLPRLPITLTNNAVTSWEHNGQVSLFSFMGMQNPRLRSTVTAAAFRLDLPDGNWTPIADAPLLNNRAKIGASAVTIGDDVYLIGGYTVSGGNEITERRLFRYDPRQDEYTEVTQVPMAVDDTVAGVYQDRYIVLTSGWHGPINNNIRNVQVYDTQQDTWIQATPLPGPGTGLFGHAGTVIGNRIVVTDGVQSGGQFRISDRVWLGELDPLGTGDVSTVAWTELPPHVGSPTYRAAASQGPDAEGRLLLVGGTDNPYNFSGTGYNGVPSSPLSQWLLFDPEQRVWSEAAVTGDLLATMDHRGLVATHSGWATIGGMTAAGAATDAVVWYQVVPEPMLPARLLAVAMASFISRRRRAVPPMN